MTANMPMAGTKTSRTPARMPGRVRGRMIFEKTFAGGAPRSSASFTSSLMMKGTPCERARRSKAAASLAELRALRRYWRSRRRHFSWRLAACIRDAGHHRNDTRAAGAHFGPDGIESRAVEGR